MKRVLVTMAVLGCAVGAGVAIAVPTASFTFSPGDPYTGEAVTFDGSRGLCDRPPCSYRWTDDGPDGPGGTNWALGSGPVLSFTFQEAGTKWVRLTVRNSSRERSSVMQPVAVAQGPRPTPTPTVTATTTATPTSTSTPTPTPDAACAVTLDSGASVSAALSSAAAGGTVCLNAGTYTYAAGTISKAAMTTAQAAPGVARSAVRITSGVDVQSSHNLAFRSMTVNGAGIGTGSATATSIQFVDVAFTDGVCVSLPGTSSSRGILIDRADFPTVPHAGCGNEGRLQFNGRNTSHSSGYDQGVTVSNSYFHGPTTGSSCTDMIQVNGDASGVTISHNEFDSLKQSACGAIHGDPIQFYGADYTTLDGNYVHGSSTGLMNGDCNGYPLKLTNNVFEDGGEISANTVRITGAGGDIIDHNAFVDTPVTFGTPNCATRATGETITNNVFTGDGINTQNSATVSGTVDYNLSTDAAARGVHGIDSVPTFAGSGSFASYVLTGPAAALTGASDGTKMGINP